MIGTDIAAFLDSPVMILLSTCGAHGRATIARGSGARWDRRTGEIHILFCASQWIDTAEHARPGAPIAVTMVRPSDYRAYQIKGTIQSTGPISEEEQLRATSYVQRMLEVMAELGVTRLQLAHTLTDRELIRVSFLPTDLFVQTPGPGAGGRVEDRP